MTKVTTDKESIKTQKSQIYFLEIKNQPKGHIKFQTYVYGVHIKI